MYVGETKTAFAPANGTLVQRAHAIQIGARMVCLYLLDGEPLTEEHEDAVAHVIGEPIVRLPVQEPPDWRPSESIPEDFCAL